MGRRSDVPITSFFSKAQRGTASKREQSPPRKRRTPSKPSAPTPSTSKASPVRPSLSLSLRPKTPPPPKIPSLPPRKRQRTTVEHVPSSQTQLIILAPDSPTKPTKSPRRSLDLVPSSQSIELELRIPDPQEEESLPTQSFPSVVNDFRHMFANGEESYPADFPESLRF